MSQFIQLYLSRMSGSKVFGKGQSIYVRGRLELIRLDLDKSKATYRVQSDKQWNTHYRISIHDYNKASIYAQCNCKYDGGGLCKHQIASLLHLSSEVLKESFNPQDEVIENEPIDTKFLQKNSEFKAYTEGVHLAGLKEIVKLKSYDTDRVIYKVRDNVVEISGRNGQYQTICTCDQRFSKLCSHKIAAFIHLGRTFGSLPFANIQKLETQKVQQLADYGYDAKNEKVSKLFNFHILNGILTVQPKDAGLSKLNTAQDWKGLRQKVFAPVKTESLVEIDSKGGEENQVVFVYVFTFDYSYESDNVRYNAYNPFVIEEEKSTLIDFKLGVVQGKWKKDKLAGRLQEINVNFRNFTLDELASLDHNDAELMRHIKDLQMEGLTRRMVQKHPELRGNWYLYSHNFTSEEQSQSLRHMIGESLKAIFKILPDKKVYRHATPTNPESLKHSDLMLTNILRGCATVEFSLDEDKNYYVLKPKIRLNDEESTEEYMPNRRKGDWMYDSTNGLILLDDKASRTLDFYEKNNVIKIQKTELPGFLADFALPLMDYHNIELNVPVELTEGEAIFNPKIYLTETEDALTLTLAFTYDYDGEVKEFEMNNRLKQMVFVRDEDEMVLVHRNDEKEAMVRDFVQKLHPHFEIQALENPLSFSLNINQLFENEWFFTAFEKIKAESIEVLGFAQLKKLKYNPNRAKINIRASSGMDWFDLEVKITFGVQSVSLKDVRKAIFNRQHYIRLGDGTLGILPQEWIEKYASMLKMGDVKGEKLRLSQFHIPLIDELYNEIDDNETLYKLMDKRNRLRNFEMIQDIPLPKNSTALLRGYQQSGYNWLNFLDEFGWGGILADDMGLGKTVQAITFLQKQVEKSDKPNLVVVPKSLVFNWQKECEKFAPELSILVYYGPQRKVLQSDIKKHALTITTYGSMRSDIMDLREIDFNYIILDESQAIKNPEALVSKAVKLLKSENRLTLTGTPIENNVFDLYSQMDFLNPGMLGNIEFFKREFSNLIDREKDVNATAQLRKLVYPFILRRTKDEVAKELPEKVESVIYCEMDKHQRRVYDGFKDKYRDMVLGRIDTEGIGNAGMYILEGLMKLRQICDSPSLLSDKEDYGHESVKLAELIPRIQEDSGRHKILIFSQFLGMLDLIKKELEKLHIPYEYLDGQTTDRHERVENFQNNAAVRVFLMSLKAGGVGLNLTAADYVYIVDPWWNPAVEAQAIDRTHRIGQEKPVFAYKMICKDTVEEKILQLQDKKKALAKDIVHVESGFVKALTRDDVVSLFS